MALQNPANSTSPYACNSVIVDSVSGVDIGAANYTAISTNGTTVVKTGAGVYFGINVITAGAASNTLIVYDGTASSTKVLTGTYTNIAAGTNALLGMVPIRFSTGLTIVSATGTAAVGNVLWD